MQRSLFTKDKEFRQLTADVKACTKCARMLNSERVFGPSCGTPEAKIMFIGEAPGRLGAESSSIPFHGDQAGHNFETLLVTLPWFHVHQIVGKFLMNGGRYGQEGVGWESAVHR